MRDTLALLVGGAQPCVLFAVATQLRLGDEILAVNGHSLQGLAHTDAVHLLREAGPTVVLRVKPNQMLEGQQL